MLLFYPWLKVYPVSDTVMVKPIGLQKLGELIPKFGEAEVFHLNGKVITSVMMKFCGYTCACHSTIALGRN